MNLVLTNPPCTISSEARKEKSEYNADSRLYIGQKVERCEELLVFGGYSHMFQSDLQFFICLDSLNVSPELITYPDEREAGKCVKKWCLVMEKRVLSTLSTRVINSRIIPGKAGIKQHDGTRCAFMPSTSQSLRAVRDC